MERAAILLWEIFTQKPFMLDKNQADSTMATENSDVPMLGSATPEERKRYVRTRVCAACSLIVILVLVIVLSNLGSSSDDSGSTDLQAIILSTTSAEGARNNSKYMSSMPHILGKNISL